MTLSDDETRLVERAVLFIISDLNSELQWCEDERIKRKIIDDMSDYNILLKRIQQ